MIKTLFVAAMMASAIGIPTIVNAASAPSVRSFSAPSVRSFSEPSYSKPYVSSPTYSKPSLAAPAASSQTYSKPATSAPSVPNASSQTYSKPTVAPAVTPTTPPASTYSKPGVVSNPQSTSNSVAPPSLPKPNSALGVAANKQISSSSLQAYQAERASAKMPPTPLKASEIKSDPGLAAARRQYSNTDQYMAQRATNITIYRNSHPDVFIYTHNMYPYYGTYDSSFLVGMMFGYVGSSVANANWLYMHQNDPWYYQWHADMQRQAQNDAAMQAKLAQMDMQLADLKAQNAHPTVSALPEGVNPSIAIAPEAMLAVTDDQPHGSSVISFLIWGTSIIIVFLFIMFGYFYVVGSRK